MDTGGLIICRPKPISYQRGDTIGFSLLSDLHVGAAHVDYPAIERELATAKEHDDRILINGDIFDAIIASDKKRYTPGTIHPRLAGRNDLLNAALEWAVELLAPYADLIDLIGVGNHETSIEKYGSLDLGRLLWYELEKHKSPDHTIHYGGYGGYLDYRFRLLNSDGNPERPDKTGKRLVIFYHHGSGGSTPVTKGMINFARASWAKSDVVWMGHRHTRFNASVASIRCPVNGTEPLVREIRQIQTGAYFLTYGGQSQASVRKHGRRSNYAADWLCSPQGSGGARLLVTIKDFDEPVEMRVVQ